MIKPPVVDIHVHPDLKTFLSSNEEINRSDCWQNINLPFFGKIIDRILLGNILESQSSLTQLNNASGTIAFVGLLAPEKAMIKGNLINLLLIPVNLITIAKVLEIIGHPNILNYQLLNRISKCRSRNCKVFNEAQRHLIKSESINPGYKLLNTINGYNPGMLNIILTVEGGHNLFKRTCGCGVRKKVLDNLNDMKSGNYRYLFLSPAHLARNRLCTHAYGMKFLHHRNFKPVGYGITCLGRKVIKMALSNPKRILIDIKHMSLVARKQYYEMLQEINRSETIPIPIIASHVGVTGVSYDRMPVVSCKKLCRWSEVLYYQPNGLNGTKFNPWSINLYDEEIITIVNSKGLIGLSLDARILGAKQKMEKERIEYFSRKEYRCSESERHPVSQINMPVSDLELTPLERKIKKSEEALKEKLIKYLQAVIKEPYKYKDLGSKDKERTEIEKEYNDLLLLEGQLASTISLTDNDMKHLCNNILHIVKTGGVEAWKHICIGSDFDGLVSAVKCCRDATKYDDLANGLKHWLPGLAGSNPGLPPNTTIDQVVYDIVAGNAYNFLKVNFI